MPDRSPRVALSCSTRQTGPRRRRTAGSGPRPMGDQNAARRNRPRFPSERSLAAGHEGLCRRAMDRRRQRRHLQGDQPGAGRRAVRGRRPRPRRDRPRHCRGRGRDGGLAGPHRQGAGQYLARLVQPDDGKPGRSGADPHRRDGQADQGVDGRGRLWRQLHRVVRRGRQTDLRRDDPAATCPTCACR